MDGDDFDFSSQGSDDILFVMVHVDVSVVADLH